MNDGNNIALTEETPKTGKSELSSHEKMLVRLHMSQKEYDCARSEGKIVFHPRKSPDGKKMKTSDGTDYDIDENGTIHRKVPSMNKKERRRLRKEQANVQEQ